MCEILAAFKVALALYYLWFLRFYVLSQTICIFKSQISVCFSLDRFPIGHNSLSFPRPSCEFIRRYITCFICLTIIDYPFSEILVPIDLIFGDLLQSVFSAISAPDNTVQSKLVSLINVAGF